VYATEIRSARHYGRHSHATFGFGVMGDGAQRSSSGRGMVDAYAGNNPGEVHDAGQDVWGVRARSQLLSAAAPAFEFA
jgi:hypothetical protein